MELHATFVIVYLVALIGVGALKARKVKNQEDFSLAGRGLSTFVLVGTLLATWIGTGSILGNAEKSYRVGYAAFLIPISGALGIVALYLLAGRIRRFAQFTIQDILEARFGFAARVIGTVTLLMAYVIIVSYQYRAGAGVVHEFLPDLDPRMATVGVALFVIVYTALAGMFSVAYTDVVNGILIIIGIACALPILLSEAGGFEGVSEALAADQKSLFGTFGPLELLSILLPAFLLLIGDANMYQRFFSARDAGSARRSAGWMFVGVILLECAIIAAAILGAALVAQGALPTPVEDDEGYIIVRLAFHVLPDFLGAVLVATVVAIVVSTADSYLLAPSTAVVRDVYQRMIRPAAGDREVVWIGRGVVVLLGLVALGLAFASQGFFDIALFAYTIYGAGITPALLAAFFWPRATTTGAVSSMLTGVGTAIVWKYLVADGGLNLGAKDHWLAGVDAVLPAVLVSVVVLVTVSLATPPPDAEKAHAI